jgi:hypothetical protein
VLKTRRTHGITSDRLIMAELIAITLGMISKIVEGMIGPGMISKIEKGVIGPGSSNLENLLWLMQNNFFRQQSHG